jgi:hypothetical protein
VGIFIVLTRLALPRSLVSLDFIAMRTLLQFNSKHKSVAGGVSVDVEMENKKKI